MKRCPLLWETPKLLHSWQTRLCICSRHCPCWTDPAFLCVQTERAPTGTSSSVCWPVPILITQTHMEQSWMDWPSLLHSGKGSHFLAFLHIYIALVASHDTVSHQGVLCQREQICSLLKEPKIKARENAHILQNVQYLCLVHLTPVIYYIPYKHSRRVSRIYHGFDSMQNLIHYMLHVKRACWKSSFPMTSWSQREGRGQA